ncbi:MAG: 50S ribosomal protein L11 methyltransferase [Firmicutes bacterium]|nr:50S ribosomal protein L11 methyltransferase [Bacillota bacterium]
MKWMEITVTTSQEAKEAAADILYQQGVNGLVIEDSYPVALAADVEDYTPLPETEFPLEEVRLIAYLPVDEELASKVESIRQLVAALADYDLDPGRAEVTLSEVQEEDWANAWKDYYKPIPVGEKLLIKPSWEEIAPTDRLVIELHPAMAFGTGSHATTTMCLEILEREIKGGERVIDVGCGSGILSIAAARLGASQVEALDYDPVAVKVARENVSINEVADKVRVAQSDLLQAASAPADIIVANIIARIIIQLIPQIDSFLAPGGLFIASGIIGERLDAVLAALAAHDFVVVEQKHENDWYALVCHKRE